MNILNAILLSEIMPLNYSEISTYETMYYELKNIQNVLGILLKTILKIRNNRFYKNFYSKIFKVLQDLLNNELMFICNAAKEPYKVS